MKKVGILLSMLFVLLISTYVFAARWDGATVDMSGSSSGDDDICKQGRPLGEPINQRIWDMRCGGNNTPTPTPDVDPYKPDTSQPDDFDWDKWQRDFDRDWDNPADHKFEREEYNRKVKEWADGFSHWVIYSMPAFFYYHPDVAANLPELRRDLYNPVLRGKIERCLSNHVANDVDNIRNIMNSFNDDDRDIGYQIMTINNCYRQLR